MRPFLTIALTIGFSFVARSQIQVGVWTDKPVYRFGDTVAITVTAYNPTADTVSLYFSDACQNNCIIDTFNFHDYLGYAGVESIRPIPPYSTFRWPSVNYPFYNSGWPLLAPGTHYVIGEVFKHGFSDTLLIIVESTTEVSQHISHPASFLLGTNYPNPFNGETTIPFSLSTSRRVTISLYNAIGQLVRMSLDETLPAGSHQIRVNISDLSSGVYWCCMQVGGQRQTSRLMLTK